MRSLRAMGKSDREILELLREDAEWYMNEIKVMQQLKGSANIVNIEDSALCEKEGSIAFDLFIRMEYLTSLHQHLAEISPITEEDIIKLGCDICSAHPFRITLTGTGSNALLVFFRKYRKITERYARVKQMVYKFCTGQIFL